jgi:hypothetical protein
MSLSEGALEVEHSFFFRQHMGPESAPFRCLLHNIYGKSISIAKYFIIGIIDGAIRPDGKIFEMIWKNFKAMAF